MLALALAVSMGFSAYAAAPSWTNLFEQAEHKLRNIRPSATAVEFRRKTLQGSPCYKLKSELFYRKPIVDIRIAFGYKDALTWRDSSATVTRGSRWSST